MLCTIGGGIIDAVGEGLRQRGSSWLECDSNAFFEEEALANHDLLEGMLKATRRYDLRRIEETVSGPGLCHANKARCSCRVFACFPSTLRRICA